MATPEPECAPCRGTGRVVSNLDGESRTIACPWCRGSGVKQPGIDAQAAWSQEEAEGRAGRKTPA
jgi:hypothetical protein